MLKNFLSQKMLQKLTPQQIQIMKLLQVPTAELEQRIQEELEGNPALEELESEKDEFINEVSPELKDNDSPNQEKDSQEEESYITQTNDNKDNDYEDFDGNNSDDFGDRHDNPQYEEYLEQYMNDDTPNYKLNANLTSADEEDKTTPGVVESTFYEYMQEQLHLLELDSLEEKIALQIIGSLNEDGYLTRDVEALSDDLLFAHNINIEPSQIEKVLLQIQTLDPAGIAAQNLQECLQLQLQRKLKSDDLRKNYSSEGIRYLKLALDVITDYFDEFSRKHYPKLLQQLNIDKDELKDITKEILKLNPKPGSVYASASKSSKQYITPDFTIETNSLGELELSLNSRNAPDLRVSEHYKEMLQAYTHKSNLDKKQKEAVLFVKQKIESARWFIDAIRQRQQTMLSVMQAIMVYQQTFLLTGDEKNLKPMILKDIADLTSLDISTVSRVVNEKYVQTEFGIKRLREFFTEGILNDEGDEVSTAEIKQLLTEFVQNEDKEQPLSDEKLRLMLVEKGFSIARRTVAKYREELNIAVARLRKEL